eukprot:125728_1
MGNCSAGGSSRRKRSSARPQPLQPRRKHNSLPGNLGQLEVEKKEETTCTIDLERKETSIADKKRLCHHRHTVVGIPDRETHIVPATRRDNVVFRQMVEDFLVDKATKEGDAIRWRRKSGIRQPIRLPSSESLGNSDKQFEYLDTIGRGAFGRVVRVRHKVTRDLYALKILDKRIIRGLGAKYIDMIHKERDFLSMFDHPFIVRLLFDFETKRYVFLVTELVRGPSIYKEMRRRGKLPESQVRIWVAEIILAIQHMHERKVVYRDLKPDNVMIDQDGHARIIDMGLAEHVENGKMLYRITGAKGYKAPEMLAGQHSYEVDWWNLGVFMFQMLAGKHPMHRRFSKLTLDQAIVKHMPIKMSSGFSPEARSLLKGLMNYDPKERLGSGGADLIKIHPFFFGLDWDRLKQFAIPLPQHELIHYKAFDEDQKPQFKNAQDLMRTFQKRASYDRALRRQQRKTAHMAAIAAGKQQKRM